jgi:hypothetical protein
MSSHSKPSFLACALALTLAACASHPAPCPDTQAIVDSVMKTNPDIVRLTVHTTPPSGGAICAVASSLPSKRGAPSDPEDHRAIETGQKVVLKESGAVDVTVPILQKDGKYTAAAGVTLKSAAGTAEATLVSRAEAVARQIETELQAKAMKK